MKGSVGSGLLMSLQKDVQNDVVLEPTMRIKALAKKRKEGNSTYVLFGWYRVAVAVVREGQEEEEEEERPRTVPELL